MIAMCEFSKTRFVKCADASQTSERSRGLRHVGHLVVKFGITGSVFGLISNRFTAGQPQWLILFAMVEVKDEQIYSSFHMTPSLFLLIYSVI